MALEFNLIKSKNLGRLLAICFISVALLIFTAEFILQCINEGFYFENLFAFLFEVLTNGALILALILKAPFFIEIMLVVLKVFEGSYYPLRSAQRLDLLILFGGTTFDIINHILFAVTAFTLLIALVFFIIYKIKNKINFWTIMKILLLVAVLFMFISAILYSVDAINHHGHGWEEILEPIGLALLIFGMFITCEYVEEETVYE